MIDLECDKEPKHTHNPYYEIFNSGEDKLFISKICHEHGDVKEEIIEMNPFKKIKIKCFELSVQITVY